MRSVSFVVKNLSPSLQQRCIGTTFGHDDTDKSVFSAMPRGMQVTRDVHQRAPISWFAIDDNGLGWPLWSKNNLIHTNGVRGISDPLVQQAIATMLENF